VIAYISDKINYIERERKSNKYKKVLLEQEIVRKNIGEGY
jgi:hypothetical protein